MFDQNVAGLGRTTEAALGEVAKAVQGYFDMLYACDAAAVDMIFHPQAQLCTEEEGRIVYRSVEDYKTVLRGRTPPASTHAPRADQILLLDMSSPTQALVKARMRVNDLRFIDYLTWMLTADGWRIVSKTYQRLANA